MAYEHEPELNSCAKPGIRAQNTRPNLPREPVTRDGRKGRLRHVESCFYSGGVVGSIDSYNHVTCTSGDRTYGYIST